MKTEANEPSATVERGATSVKREGVGVVEASNSEWASYVAGLRADGFNNERILAEAVNRLEHGDVVKHSTDCGSACGKTSETIGRYPVRKPTGRIRFVRTSVTIGWLGGPAGSAVAMRRGLASVGPAATSSRQCVVSAAGCGRRECRVRFYQVDMQA